MVVGVLSRAQLNLPVHIMTIALKQLVRLPCRLPALHELLFSCSLCHGAGAMDWEGM